MEDGELLNACLSLLWRLPPQDTHKNTTSLCQLLPEKAEQIFRRVQRPSILVFDSSAASFFLAGDWNKVGESYRSPLSADSWFKADGTASTGNDVPPQDRVQSSGIREVEKALNKAAQIYRKTRYPLGHASAYAWNFAREEGFACAILFRNAVAIASGDKNDKNEMIWNAVHVAHVSAPVGHAYIHLKSTVYLTLEVENESVGHLSMGSRCINVIESTRYLTGNAKGHDAHVDGVMVAVEEAESAIAFQLKDMAIPRTRQTIQALRLDDPIHAQHHREIINTLNKAITGES